MTLGNTWGDASKEQQASSFGATDAVEEPVAVGFPALLDEPGSHGGGVGVLAVSATTSLLRGSGVLGLIRVLVLVLILVTISAKGLPSLRTCHGDEVLHVTAYDPP